MAKYKLPNKYHEVVKDIADLRETLCAIETNIDVLDEHRLTAERKVEKFSDGVVHSAVPFENSEIKNFAANKYLKIVDDGIEATEGGGNAGGIASQCLVKKFDEGKDCGWINLIEVEKDGIVHVGNNGDAGSNEAHVFSDLEDANFVGAPRSEVVNIQIKNNSLETQSNAAFLIKNEIEEIPEIAADTNPTEIASSNNYGLVQIGKNINVDEGEISIDDAPVASSEIAGIVQLSHGFEIEDGNLNCVAKREATFEKTGLIKPGDEFDFEHKTLVLKDMSDAKIIYKLGQFKVVKNGQIDLDEKCQIYRMHVTEDLQISINVNFEPEADFGFLLSVYSNDVHVLKCSQKLLADGNDTIKLGRGLNQIYITKKLGVDYYTATIDARGTIPEELLTDSNVACNSKYIMWSPGGDRSPVNFVPNGGGSYPRDPWVYFEFFSPVCVTKLSVDVFENWNYPTCVFYGSNDGKNWTILLDRSGESSGAHGDLYPDVKGFYRFFKFNLVCDSRWGYMSSFRMYGYHLNNPMQTVTMLNRIATTTASGVEEGSNINNLVNDDANTLIYVTPDENGKKWIKWEFEQPQFVNIFRLDFQRPDNYDRQVSWFKLEASEDGEEWELLFERNSLEVEDFKNNHSVYWHLNPEKAYKFYRVVCERTNDFRYENWMIYGVKIYQIEDGRAIVQKIVPEMNSASQDGFEVTASSIYADDHAAYYAFDDNPNTRWGAKDYDNQWLQIKLPDPAVVNAVEMRARVCCPIQMPKSFVILASDDGENFVELFATEDAEAWQSSEKRTYTFDNTTPYLYYRLKINSSHDGRTIALSCLNFGNATREYKRELHVFDYIIPLLLGDETTTNEGVYKISSSSEHSEHKRYYLFDRNFGTRFETNGTPDGWIQVELPVAKVVNYFQVGARNDSWCNAAPRNYSLLASNDGSTWTTLSTVESETEFTGSELREHPLTNTAAYKFYKLEFSNGNRGNVLTFARWDLIFRDEIKEY